MKTDKLIVQPLPIHAWHCPHCSTQYMRTLEYFRGQLDESNQMEITCYDCLNTYTIELPKAVQ